MDNNSEASLAFIRSLLASLELLATCTIKGSLLGILRMQSISNLVKSGPLILFRLIILSSFIMSSSFNDLVSFTKKKLSQQISYHSCY